MESDCQEDDRPPPPPHTHTTSLSWQNESALTDGTLQTPQRSPSGNHLYFYLHRGRRFSSVSGADRKRWLDIWDTIKNIKQMNKASSKWVTSETERPAGSSLGPLPFTSCQTEAADGGFQRRSGVQDQSPTKINPDRLLNFFYCYLIYLRIFSLFSHIFKSPAANSETISPKLKLKIFILIWRCFFYCIGKIMVPPKKV